MFLHANIMIVREVKDNDLSKEWKLKVETFGKGKSRGKGFVLTRIQDEHRYQYDLNIEFC